jgi:signal peptidase I
MKGLNNVKDISADLLENGFAVRISTLGLSMFPHIAPGDRIIISPQKDFNIGDLIVFAQADTMVCHRLAHVFARDGIRYYRTRGDNCSALDEPVTSDQVIGKAIKVERPHISLARKVLLFIYPVLRFGRLNAMVVSALMMVRNIVKRQTP